MARKERIEFMPEAPVELNNPFANLQIDNLPLGEPIQSVPPAQEREGKSKLGRVVLRRETAHRGGKTVIVIHDFAPSIPMRSIEDLARKLRSACGCGGTTRQRTIEIQGNQAEKIRSLLEQEGYRVAGVK